MANKEHVKRLKQGVAKWNAWREKKELSPNLRGADLSTEVLMEANLARANLSDANLSDAILARASLMHADLTGANLDGAILRDANLSSAILINASLRRADLSRTQLDDADLTGSDLSGTDLSDAILRDANLKFADLTETTLRRTVFGDADLNGVIGLETCIHEGPSTIDHQTLQNSKPLPPLTFLRGVGLPDMYIEYLPSLFDQAIQYYSCFISYSSKDQDFADRIHADLQDNGVRCWFAPHDMPIGGKILDEIDVAIRLREREQVMLFPVRLDDAVMDTSEAWAAKLRARHIGDFRRWKDHDGYTTSFQRVLRDLKRPAKNGAALKP